MTVLVSAIEDLSAFGFQIPVLPTALTIKRDKGATLTLEQEQAFGFSSLSITLAQIQAIACDCELVSNLLDEMDEAFTYNDLADKAVALVKVGGHWVRNGSLPAAQFTALARARIGNARNRVRELRAIEGQVRDLFYMEALASLRDALSEIVPYDMVLARATSGFKQRCRDLNAACQDLVQYVSREMYLDRPAALDLCEQSWLSSKLPAQCLSANRYVYSIMPAAAKRDVRQGIMDRQQRLANVALSTGVPVAELLASWASFSKRDLQANRLASSFAEANRGLAESIARDYRCTDDFEDVSSAAFEGLGRAITLYAPEKGLKFSTYATAWIKQTIIRSLIKQQLIRLPEGSHPMLGRIRAVYSDLPHASDEYVCAAANISPDDLERLKPYLRGNGALSLDSLVTSDGDAEDLHNVIADENNDFAGAVEEEDLSSHIADLIRNALDQREFFVVCSRLGIAGTRELPANEVAESLGTTHQNVRRILKQAMVKLSEINELKALWGM